MITKSKNEQIEIILEDIDLSAIQKTMEHLDLRWKDSSTGERRVPNEQEIAIVARDCMDRAWNAESKIARIGRFESEVIEGVIELKFILTQANTLSNLLG